VEGPRPAQLLTAATQRLVPLGLARSCSSSKPLISRRIDAGDELDQEVRPIDMVDPLVLAVDQQTQFVLAGIAADGRRRG
jgi:hypothetical protein